MGVGDFDKKKSSVMKAAHAFSGRFACIALSACDESNVGFDAKCKEYCAALEVTENQSQATITPQRQAMGRRGTPQVLIKNKTEIGFTCPA
jgi:hypothetical protein